MTAPPTPSRNLQAALAYATKLGWHVFPVRPDKKPYTPHGFYDASNDPAVITRWWSQFPDAAIGLRTGAESGVAVLDVDQKHDGFATLDLLLSQHGALPLTVTTVTGGGGRHFFFKHPGQNCRCTRGEQGLGKGLDTRGDGGYVILPPSKHGETGNLYGWETPPWAAEIATLPAWLLAFLTTAQRPVSPSVSAGNPLATTDAIPDGARNDTLFRMAGILRAQGMEEEDILTTLTAVNAARCDPPLPDSELRTIARSICRYDAGPVLVEEWDGSGPTDLISNGSLWRPRGATTPDETDLGNAQRFAEQHGEDVRYIKAWNRWLLWAGSYWRTSDTAEAERLAHLTAESINDEVRALRVELSTLSTQLQADTQAQAAAMADGAGVDIGRLDVARRRAAQLEESIKHLSKHARDSKSDRSLRSMLRLAGQLAGIDTASTELDRDPFLFNVINGTLDLRTGNLRPHDRADLLTRVAPVPYDPLATCPRWESFLLEIMQGDAELTAYLQRAVGYSLTGSVSAQVLFFLHGDGRNGKSTFINILRSLLGPYAAIGQSTLLEEGDRHPTELADLCGRRAAIISETEDSKPLPQAQIKRLTSEEPIRARRMREDSWEFTPTHKLWISGNHKPTVRGGDLGIWRRLQLIPFRYTIPEDRVDPELPGTLATELPGIFAWAVRGCAEYRTSGLRPPAAVRDATAEYRDAEDLIGQFLADACQLGPGLFTPSSRLYTAYRTWAEAGGFKPLDIKRFKERMEKHCAYTRTMTARGWQGVQITPTGPQAVQTQR